MWKHIPIGMSEEIQSE